MISTRLYRDGKLAESDFDSALVSDHLQESGTHVWLDLAAPQASDLGLLAEEFGLHDLAIEDATKPHQRPKIEHYDNHTFLVLYALKLDGAAVVQSEVDVFFGDRYIITVRKEPVLPMGPVLAKWDSMTNLGNGGVGPLLHGLLDVIVDDYFVVVDGLSDQIEEFEDAVLRSDQAESVQEDLLDLRKVLVEVRRLVVPLTHVMTILSRREPAVFGDAMVPYFQDVFDHTLRVADSIEVMRELLASVLDVHLSMTANNLNTIMKKITGWAAVLGLATTIAGIYGMNFTLVPKDQTLFGFWFALGLMFVSCSLLYLYFKKKKWF